VVVVVARKEEEEGEEDGECWWVVVVVRVVAARMVEEEDEVPCEEAAASWVRLAFAWLCWWNVRRTCKWSTGQGRKRRRRKKKRRSICTRIYSLFFAARLAVSVESSSRCPSNASVQILLPFRAHGSSRAEGMMHAFHHLFFVLFLVLDHRH